MIFAAGGKTRFSLLPAHPFRVLLAVALASLALAASSGAALIGIYRNPMESQGQRSEVLKLSGQSCQRGGSSHALRIAIGKKTRECSYRTPVIGRDLEIAATMRLLENTPKALRTKAFLALTLRSGEGAHYQLAVFPLQRKAQLRKTLPDGSVKFLRIAKNVKAVMGIDKANKLRLQAFNITQGPEKGRCRILGYVGNQQVADFTDSAAGELQGRASGFVVGATKNAKGVVASVDDLVVRAPSPF
jgi:hypothetical protein